MKTLKFFSLLAACSLAFACVPPVTPDPGTDPGTDPVEPVEPKAELVVSAAEMLSAEITLKTEGLTEYAYICSNLNDLSTEPLMIFKDGVTGELAEAETKVVISGLEANATYTAYFAFKVSDEEFFEDVLSVEFTTTDYQEAFTVISKNNTGFKWHLKMPQSVKDANHALRYAVGSLPVYKMNKIGWRAMLEPDLLLYNGQHHVKGDTTLVYDETNVYELDEDGNQKIDESTNEPIMLHTPFVPGEPIVFTAGEFEWDDTDSQGWGLSGYYTACFNFDAYYENAGGGGWGPWSVEVDGEPLDEDEYWTGYFTRKYITLDPPAELDAKVDVAFNVGAMSGTVTFTPDSKVYQYCYMILPEYEYEGLLPFIDNNEDYLQWFTTSYVAAIQFGAASETEPLELVLEKDYYLEPETTYHLLLTAMGDEKGTSQSFQHLTFETTAKTHPAPTVLVTPISNPDGEESPYEVWFNVKCTSKNAVSGKYAANYEREFAMMLNSGYTYTQIAAQGNYLSAADIAEINSDEGMNFMFSSMPDSQTRLAILLYNDEETGNNIDQDLNATAVKTTIKEPAKPAVDSPLFTELLGDWTMSAPTQQSVYNNETFSYEWKDSGVKTAKVTISNGFTYPETLPESVYETYNKLVGKDKAEVDALYDEFKAEIDEYNAKLKSQNRLLCTGFGFQETKTDLNYNSPFDLFCSETYNGYDNESMIWDCGPKWFIEINEDGSAVVPINDTRFYPLTTAGYYTYYLVGNGAEGYMSIGPDGENEDFPVEVADDYATATINPFVYNDSEYYLNAMRFYYGYGYISEFLVSAPTTLTKGWTEADQPEAGASSVKTASDIAVPSVNSSSVKAVSAKRKTALKAMKKYEQRPLKLVSVEQAIAKIKNDNAR